MNTKTAARMRRVSATLTRIESICRREIRYLEKIQHLKPEDFHAAVKLRELADLSGRYAAESRRPHNPELPLPEQTAAAS